MAATIRPRFVWASEAREKKARKVMATQRITAPTRAGISTLPSGGNAYAVKLAGSALDTSGTDEIAPANAPNVLLNEA